MPDDFEVPDWVSEPRAATTDSDEPTPAGRGQGRRGERVTRREDGPAQRRRDRHRRGEPQRSSLGRTRRDRVRDGEQRRADSNGTSNDSSTSVDSLGSDEFTPVPGESVWLTRAERRRRLEAAGSRGQLEGLRDGGNTLEMVPPASGDEEREHGRDDELGLETRARRRSARPRARTRQVTFARRRAAAALAVTAAMVLLLWSLWPSSTSPERQDADLSASALREKSDPTPAAEDLPTAVATATPRSSVAPSSGTGKLTSVALPTIATPQVNPNRTVRVGLQVEQGAGVDAAEAASIVSSTLGDARGWQTRDEVRFRAVSPVAVKAGDVDITIVLASPELTDELCAPLKTRGEVSCFNLRKVVLNVRRWTQGVSGYGKDLAAYRQYMVNHEVGHGLYHGHVECPRKGAIAPIMLQQSKGLDGCLQNPWPTAG